MNRFSKLWVCAAASLSLGAPAPAANKLQIEAQTVAPGATNVSIPIKLDSDQKLYGFSLSLTTDASKLKITGIDLTGAVVPDAGWSFGQVLQNGSRISWGVVLDITEPFDVAKVIPAGAKLVIANLKVDVTAASAGSATVTFQDFAANPPAPAAKNLLVGDQGVPVAFTSSNGTITIEEPAGQFHRGDADGNSRLELTDAIRILNFLFTGGAVLTCLDAADADDNGNLELTDAIRILGFLFLGQAAPALPGPPPNPCGSDPPGTAPLGCDQYTC